MILTLCWKEYREQRGLWLAIALLAVVLVVGLGEGLSQYGLWGAHQDPDTRSLLGGLVISLVLAQGVVCGAQLLAGDKEAGTLAFLDALSARRAPLWHSKLAAGIVLTLLQAVVLAAMMIYLRFGSWGLMPTYVVLGLEALLWGLVGGAYCQKVFVAVLIGIVFLAGSLVLSLLCPRGVDFVVHSSLALVAGYVSWRRYAEPDAVRTAREQTPSCHEEVLIWLCFRQGRLFLLGGLVACLIAGFLMHLAPVILWPGTALAVGLVCGIMVFAPEQTGEQERFLGTLRLPPGMVWRIKIFFWGIAAILLLFLAGGMALIVDAQTPRGSPRQTPERLWGILGLGLGGRPALLVAFWLLHGFCFGQFFVLLARKTIVAAVLATGACLVVLGLWFPAMLLGRPSAWQILAIPLLLLVATRFALWPWFCGRMYSRRPLFGMVTCVFFAAAWQGGNLWYRAVEVPDVGEPFDLQAHEASLNRAAQSEAGALIRKAGKEMVEHQQKVTDKLGPPTKPVYPAKADAPPRENLSYGHLVDEVLTYGWPPEGEEIGRWLDLLFAHPWADHLHAAAQLPLGLILDPRKLNFSSSVGDLYNCQSMAAPFTARALQWQTRGDNQAALKHLATVLALSRHTRNYAFLHSHIETTALAGFGHWLGQVGPRANLLRRGLEMCQRHERESPAPLDNLKAGFLEFRNSLELFFEPSSSLERGIIRLSLECPWEKQRFWRVVHAHFQARWQRAQVPSGKPAHLEEWHKKGYQDLSSQIAFESGLPLADGPTTALSPRQWGRLIQENWPVALFFRFPLKWERDYLARLRAFQLQIALALYQLDHRGKPAASLDDLAPRYVPAVPLDPLRNEPFRYRISQGEKIYGLFLSGESPRTEQLAAGQGLVWLESAESIKGPSGKNYRTWYFPVPLWKK